MVAAGHSFAETGDISCETRRHKPGKLGRCGFSGFDRVIGTDWQPHPRNIIATRLYQDVAGFLKHDALVLLDHDQLVHVSYGFKHAVQVLDVRFRTFPLGNLAFQFPIRLSKFGGALCNQFLETVTISLQFLFCPFAFGDILHDGTVLSRPSDVHIRVANK